MKDRLSEANNTKEINNYMKFNAWDLYEVIFGSCRHFDLPKTYFRIN